MIRNASEIAKRCIAHTTHSMPTTCTEYLQCGFGVKHLGFKDEVCLGCRVYGSGFKVYRKPGKGVQGVTLTPKREEVPSTLNAEP